MTESEAKVRFIRRTSDGVAVIAGLAVLGLGMLAVRHGTVSSFEESVFHAINDLPGALYPILWPFQQLGAVLVGPLVAVVALILRKYRLALAALLATVAKLVLERLVKAMVSRERPSTSIGPDVHRRGNVSVHGEAFVSGHAVLVASLAMIVQPYLRGHWKVVPWVVVALVMITRVYVGAHNPLDVIAGAGLGVAIGGVLNLIVGVPETQPTSITNDSAHGQVERS
jgi:undecaprenyl-diphosphatase